MTTSESDLKRDVNPKDAVPLSCLARMLPERKRIGTVNGWARVGRKNRHTGEIIKLPTIRLPSGRGSSLDAYYQWLEDLDRTE